MQENRHKNINTMHRGGERETGNFQPKTNELKAKGTRGATSHHRRIHKN